MWFCILVVGFLYLFTFFGYVYLSYHFMVLIKVLFCHTFKLEISYWKSHIAISALFTADKWTEIWYFYQQKWQGIKIHMLPNKTLSMSVQ